MAYFVFGDKSGGLANRQDRYVVIAAVGGERVRNFEKNRQASPRLVATARQAVSEC